MRSVVTMIDDCTTNVKCNCTVLALEIIVLVYTSLEAYTTTFPFPPQGEKKKKKVWALPGLSLFTGSTILGFFLKGVASVAASSSDDDVDRGGHLCVALVKLLKLEHI